MAITITIGALWALQRRVIYFPERALPELADVLPGAQEVALTTDDGLTLGAWFVPATSDTNGVTVVVFNGNGGNRGGRIPLAKALSAQGYGVLLFDYRGYGGNPGSPSESGLISDGLAAVAYLETRDSVDSEQIVYFGESLGAAVAIGVAEQRLPAALVLRSPFTSLPDVAAVHYPFLPTSLFLRDRYPNRDRVSGLHVPVLVMAGSADSVVPLAQSKRVYEAAGEPKEFVVFDGADHNDFELTAGEELVATVAEFLERVGLPGDR